VSGVVEEAEAIQVVEVAEAVGGSQRQFHFHYYYRPHKPEDLLLILRLMLTRLIGVLLHSSVYSYLTFDKDFKYITTDSLKTRITMSVSNSRLTYPHRLLTTRPRIQLDNYDLPEA
jgi:hypothetical protein